MLQALWRAAFTSRQLPLPQDFPLLLLCTASEGFTPADIKQVRARVLLGLCCKSVDRCIVGILACVLYCL